MFVQFLEIVMAKNKTQYQKGFSFIDLQDQYGIEE